MVLTLFLVFFVLLIIGVPVAFALGIGSCVSLLVEGSVPLMVVAQKMYSGLNNFSFMAIPLFLIAGNIMAEAKISDKLIALADLCVGRFIGGLADICTAASAFFGAISGSAPATTAAIGSLMIPSMEKHKYNKEYSSAVVAASGVLGLIIPPSLTMVVYGVTAGVSIGRLFANGFVPGIILCFILFYLNYYIAKKEGIPRNLTKYSKEDKKVIIKDSLIALMMPVIILGGIYSGVFTATESASIACLYGVVVGVFVYHTINLKVLFKIFRNSVENVAMIFTLMATASIFGFILAKEQVPQKLAMSLLALTDNTYIIMLILLVSLLVLGTFLDNVGALVLITPTIVQIANSAGIDLIYLGVFMIIALAVGQITPPVGLNLFVVVNISNSKFEKVVQRIIPYIGAYILALVLFVIFPKLLCIF